MNSEEQSQDFEKLQRLLKLKRYEQPPPRYFNDFSSKVIAHVRQDTSISRFETADDLISRTPWLRRLWRKLENQPALSGALATAVCGLMVAGVFLVEEKPLNVTINPVGEESGTSKSFATVPAFGNNISPAAAALPQAFSTNVGLNLFDHLPSLQTLPVNQSGKPLWQKK